MLSLAVSTHLLPRFERYGAGRLTKVRAQAVSGPSCARVARSLGVPERLKEAAPLDADRAAELLAESEFETRYPIWEQIQEKHYTTIPAIKIGDYSTTSFRSDKVGGWVDQFERGVMYWNLWLEE